MKWKKPTNEPKQEFEEPKQERNGGNNGEHQ